MCSVLAVTALAAETSSIGWAHDSTRISSTTGSLPPAAVTVTLDQVCGFTRLTDAMERFPDRDEIEKVARELWLSRGGPPGSPNQDWYQAEQIVQNRRKSNLAGGNSTSTAESYSAGAYQSGAPNQTQNTERADHMEQNNLTGGNTGNSQLNNPQHSSGGGTMDSIRESASSVMDRAKESAAGVVDRAKETASGAMDKARNVLKHEPMSMPRPEHREGAVARAIEQQTARIPSDVFLWAAVGSIGLSLALELSGKEKTANFVGHWAPTLLILGLYNKMVKLQGSDGI